MCAEGRNLGLRAPYFEPEYSSLAGEVLAGMGNPQHGCGLFDPASKDPVQKEWLDNSDKYCVLVESL